MKWEQVSHLEKLVIEIVRNINVNSLTKEQKRLIESNYYEILEMVEREREDLWKKIPIYYKQSVELMTRK